MVSRPDYRVHIAARSGARAGFHPRVGWEEGPSSVAVVALVDWMMIELIVIWSLRIFRPSPRWHSNPH
jgi:hypothetical protein